MQCWQLFGFPFLFPFFIFVHLFPFTRYKTLLFLVPNVPNLPSLPQCSRLSSSCCWLVLSSCVPSNPPALVSTSDLMTIECNPKDYMKQPVLTFFSLIELKGLWKPEKSLELGYNYQEMSLLGNWQMLP